MYKNSYVVINEAVYDDDDDDDYKDDDDDDDDDDEPKMWKVCRFHLVYQSQT